MTNNDLSREWSISERLKIEVWIEELWGWDLSREQPISEQLSTEVMEGETFLLTCQNSTGGEVCTWQYCGIEKVQMRLTV